MGWLDGPGAVGTAIGTIGAAWLVLAAYDQVSPKLTAVPLGALAVLVGPSIMAPSWPTPAPIVGLTFALVLVMVADQHRVGRGVDDGPNGRAREQFDTARPPRVDRRRRRCGGHGPSVVLVIGGVSARGVDWVERS